MATRFALLVAVMSVLPRGDARSARDYPTLLWSVSDDTLEVPLGAVLDVAIDRLGVVYVLDSQNMMIRRFARGGVELTPLGRKGEGPGEFAHPALVAARPEGGCIVVQDFHGPPVCLTPDNMVCTGPSFEAARERFTMPQFTGPARVDARGRVYVSALVPLGDLASMPSGADMDVATLVLRFDGSSGEPVEILFSDRRDFLDDSTVMLHTQAGPFAARCWDVDSGGRVIYADESGRYRVIVGHPTDGATHAVDLPAKATDERDLDRLSRAIGQPVSNLPRIADVQWVGADCFLVKPVATVTDPMETQAGAIEIFNVSGESRGRRVLEIDYDPSRDAFFSRGNVLIIIKSGRRLLESSLSLSNAPTTGSEERSTVEMIRIDAYDLWGDGLRQ